MAAGFVPPDSDVSSFTLSSWFFVVEVDVLRECSEDVSPFFSLVDCLVEVTTLLLPEDLIVGVVLPSISSVVVSEWDVGLTSSVLVLLGGGKDELLSSSSVVVSEATVVATFSVLVVLGKGEGVLLMFS
jgi:hypothetical protein